MGNLPGAEVTRFGVAAAACEGLHEVFKEEAAGGHHNPSALLRATSLLQQKRLLPHWSSMPSQEPAPLREDPADLRLFPIPEPEAKLCC